MLPNLRNLMLKFLRTIMLGIILMILLCLSHSIHGRYISKFQMIFNYSDIYPFFSNYFSILSLYAVIICSVILKYLIKKLGRNPRHKKFAAQLPGPPALPIIGNDLDFLAAGEGIDKLLLEYSRKYGSMYRIWMGNRLVVVMSDVTAIEDMYRNSSLLGKPEIFQSSIKFWGNALFPARIPIWKKSRKCIEPFFSKIAVSRQIPTINCISMNYVELMKKHVDGPEFNLSDYFPYWSVDVFTRVYFDLELDWNEKLEFDFRDLSNRVTELGMYRMYNLGLRNELIADLLQRKELKTARSKLNKFAEMVLNKKFLHLQQTEVPIAEMKKNSEILTKLYIPAVHQLQQKTGLKNLVNDEITAMLSAAVDTISATSSFFLLMIAIHQEIQDKLYDELYEIFGDSDRQPQIEDIQHLPYFDQVLKETLRRFTMIPTMMRDVKEDSKIGSLIFPSGTAIMVQICDVHLNPDSYPEPLKFNPDNFSPQAVKARSKYSQLAFSAGTRGCIGKNYADLALKLTLTTLLRNYCFHTTTKMEDVECAFGFVIYKIGGYNVSIKLRERRKSQSTMRQ